MARLAPLLVLLVLVSPAAAQNGPQTAAAAAEAAQALQSYLDEVGKAGNRPDLRKPPASDWLKKIYDTDALAALPPAQGDDAPWLLKWTEAAMKTSASIVLFGVSMSPTIDQKQLERNILQYEDEYAMMMNATIRITGREADSITLFMEQLPAEQRTPVRAAGLKKMKDGIANMISGNLKSIQGMRPANAHQITQALKDTKEVWAKFLRPDDRQPLIDESKAIPADAIDAQSRRDLDAFNAALAAAK